MNHNTLIMINNNNNKKKKNSFRNMYFYGHTILIPNYAHFDSASCAFAPTEPSPRHLTYKHAFGDCVGLLMLLLSIMSYALYSH